MASLGILWLATIAAATAQRFHVTGCSSEPIAGFICGALLAPGVLAIVVGLVR